MLYIMHYVFLGVNETVSELDAKELRQWKKLNEDGAVQVVF